MNLKLPFWHCFTRSIYNFGKVSYSSILVQVEAVLEVENVGVFLGKEEERYQWTPERKWKFFAHPPGYNTICVNMCSFSISFQKYRFQLNTAMGCCFAPVQRAIRQHVQNADDKQLYPSAPMRIKTLLTVCLFRTHVRPTTSAGKKAQGLLHRLSDLTFFSIYIV